MRSTSSTLPRPVLLRAAAFGATLLAVVLPRVAGAQAPGGIIGADVVSLDAWDWLGLVVRLAAVLAIVWAAFWGMRWYTRRTQSAGGQRGELEVLETRALGPNRSLQLVRVGRRAVLVGVTAERISQLIEIDDPEEVDRIAQSIEAQRGTAPGLGRLAGSVSRLALPSRFSRRNRGGGRTPAQSSIAPTTEALTGGQDFAPPAVASQQLQASAAYRQARIAELQRAIEEARRGTSFERVR